MGGPADWLCHGDPGRAFAPSGEPMALCARCLGMYLGCVAGVIAGAVRGRIARVVVALSVAQLPLLGVLGWPDVAAGRAVSGYAFGVAIGRVVVGGSAWGGWRAWLAMAGGATAVVALATVRVPGFLVQSLPVLGLGVLFLAWRRDTRASP